MNKKTIVIAAIVLIAIIGAYEAYQVRKSRRLSPPATATYSANGLDISVDYFRPSKRGRVIFGDSTDGALQPNGKYWRMGANEATEISFSNDVIFAGKPLKEGRYRMYANLDDSLWMISINSEQGAWGYSEPNHDLDILKVEVPVEKVAAVTEKFTISFDSDSKGVNMYLDWDNRHVKIPIGVQ